MRQLPYIQLFRGTASQTYQKGSLGIHFVTLHNVCVDRDPLNGTSVHIRAHIGNLFGTAGLFVKPIF